MKKKIFQLLPSFLKTELIRRSLDVSKSLDAEIQFKVAETFSEFEQAFQLVHDAYVREGFISAQPSGLRVIPQHQLPSTHVLIAKKGDEVIGTLTLVRNNKTKLPLERVFNLSSIQQNGMRTAEITCLSIKSEYRRAKGGTVFANLMKFMYEFSTAYGGVDQLVVAVFPKDAIFYEGLLCFKALEKKPVDYLGAPAIALHLNLIVAPELFKRAYNWRPVAHNLYHFFVDIKVPNFQFPKRLFCEINYPTLKEEFAKKFFENIEKSNVIEFRHRKKAIRSTRIEVSCQGQLNSKSIEQNAAIKIMDVSVDGLKIITSEKLPIGSTHVANLKISSQKECQVSMVVRWTDGVGGYGLSLLAADPVWFDFVTSMTTKETAEINYFKKAM